MDFTFKEIDELIKRGYLKKEKENTFGIKYASVSTNQGFGGKSIRKLENGEIITQYSTPINVDPDDGTYDMEYETNYYKSFNDYINEEPYNTEEK